MSEQFYDNRSGQCRKWLHGLFLARKVPEKWWREIAQTMIEKPMDEFAFEKAYHKAWDNDQAVRAAESEDYCANNPYFRK